VTQKIKHLFKKTTLSANTKLFSHGLGQERTLRIYSLTSAYGTYQPLSKSDDCG
jgi:hypothetical protein